MIVFISKLVFMTCVFPCHRLTLNSLCRQKTSDDPPASAPLVLSALTIFNIWFCLSLSFIVSLLNEAFFGRMYLWTETHTHFDPNFIQVNSYNRRFSPYVCIGPDTFLALHLNSEHILLESHIFLYRKRLFLPKDRCVLGQDTDLANTGWVRL